MNEKKCSKVITTACLVALGSAIILITAVLNGCPQISIREKSESAGFNGSFEIEKSGLPVNWYIYYPPVKSGGAEISLDTADVVEGKRSLRFVVHQVEETARWGAAGLFQVFAAKSKHTYKVSFWLKNQGCKFNLMIESEKPKSRNRNRRILGEEETRQRHVASI